VRLIDIVLRQGHLSERALVDAVTNGARPHHLDRCDVCAERAVELVRWLDGVQTDAVELSDASFTPERLAAQQHQILRRLEQLDHPARVISFPAAQRHESRAGGRRVAVSWVGVAAAAGLALGIIGGQVTARLSQPAAAPTTAASDQSLANLTEISSPPGNSAWVGEELENLEVPSLRVVNDLTPKLQQTFAKNR
jgi:hypothetical protein